MHSRIPAEAVIFFQESLVKYFEEYGRHDLPWRNTADPWKILLAEILLRKTTAKQVVPIYSIISRIDLRKLTEMDLGAIEVIVTPLGLQEERSRIILLAAKATASATKDDFLKDNFLGSIRGIGQYTRNMILCTAFGCVKPGLDRNMIRVLSRVFSLNSTKSRPHTDPMLWKIAEDLVPSQNPKKFNWAIMDLAAAICRPTKPHCGSCPLESICEYSLNM